MYAQGLCIIQYFAYCVAWDRGKECHSKLLL